MDLMKRLFLPFVIVAGSVAIVATAHAFHHHGEYQAFADGREMVPGSGQLYYTGSRRDLGLRCNSCHVEAPGRIRATTEFSPALGAGNSYTPGRRYTVTVTMSGENAGLSGCGMTPNRNGITAMFVDGTGFPVGTVSPDEGGRRCGSRFVTPSATQSTVVFGDCDAVVGAQGAPGSLDRWDFDWQAPPAGGGEVVMWLGVVDGDCTFDTYNDDVYETRLTLPEG